MDSSVIINTGRTVISVELYLFLGTSGSVMVSKFD